MTNTPQRLHERLELEHKYLGEATIRPNYYAIGTDGMDRLVLNPTPSPEQRAALIKSLSCVTHWVNENTILINHEYTHEAEQKARICGLTAMLLPTPCFITAFEKSGRTILSDVEDLLDYWNRCLNDKQKQYCLLSINYDLYIAPQENFDGTVEERINPYTGKPYGRYDLYNPDPYVALFNAKLEAMSEDDQDLAIELIKSNAYTDHEKVFHTGKKEAYFDELLRQIRQLTNLLYEVTDTEVAENLELKSYQHTCLCKAASMLALANTYVDTARLSKDTTPYTEANDYRYNGPNNALSFDELITFYNNELSKKDQEEVYEILNSGNLLKPSVRDMVTTFMTHVRNLTEQELFELATLVNFHHTTQANRLFNMTDRKATGTSLTKQTDSLQSCLSKYYEHLKIQKKPDTVYMEHIEKALHNTAETSHLLFEVFKYSLPKH